MNGNFYDEDEDFNEQVVDDDDNYLEMLKGLKEPEDKRPKKYDFEGSKRYSGTKRAQMDDDELTLDEDDNVVEIERPKKKVKLSKKKKASNGFSVQGQLNQIDQEDQQIIEKTKEDTKQIQETANALKEQFAYWTTMINYRQNLQKVLENVKKLPQCSDEFMGGSNVQQMVGAVVENVQKLIDNRRQLYGRDQSEYDLQGDYMQNVGLPNNEDIQNYVYGVCSKNSEQMEEDVIKWSQKTTLIGGIQKKQGLTGSLNFGSLLQTPIGQTQKALQNKDKLILKSQLKRTIFRTLGQGPEDLNKTSSELIYDDTDFYLELLRDTIVAQPHDDSGDMMNQATQSYLLQRRAQNQEKKDKDVDRKASKSRKIRYDTHQKMINFMIPMDNNHEIEAREDIVKCLFGGNQKVPTKQKKKITKRTKSDNTITLL